jgi:outer membrane biosynthesis protein TonB
MKVRSMVMGAVVIWAAGGVARAEVMPGGLAGLDVEMNGTGRIGNPWQGSDAAVTAPNIPDPSSRQKALATAPRATRGDEDHEPARPRGDLSEQEYRQTDVAVANCRVEVARRRQVAPARLAAGTVLLRFTIEGSGRVRDAEAVSETNTDLEVAACAKRVLSDWRFAKHAGGEITVERVYQLADRGRPESYPAR